MKNKGFTLIEMMIVTVIILILIAVAIPAFQNKAKMRSAKTVVHVEETAPTPPSPLTEECVNGFAFIRGNGTVIQKMGPDGLPAQCL